MNLVGYWKLAWDSFVRGLELGRIRLHAQSDTLVWNHNRARGSAMAKSVYEYIVLTSQPPARGQYSFSDLDELSSHKDWLFHLIGDGKQNTNLG